MPHRILMKNFILLLFLPLGLFSQRSPRIAKYEVGKSGFHIYLPAKPDPVSTEYSPDSSRIYTIECADTTTINYHHFGAIVVDLNQAIGKATEELTIAYLDYLKSTFSITSATGYGKGHELSTHPSAKGIIDHWKDESGDEWQVVAWYAEQYIVVQFVYGSEELKNPNQWELFKKGIRFPGDK